MRWQEHYQARRTSPSKAVATIKSGQRVLLHACCSEPQTLVEALLGNCHLFEGVELVTELVGGRAPYTRPEYKEHFRLRTLLANVYSRDAMAEGRADYIPCSLSETPRLFTEGYLPVDVALLQLSPPDNDGYCSFGLTADFSWAAAQVAKTRIAEINQQYPHTLGPCRIRVTDLDYIVESDREPLQMPPLRLGEVERGIGEHVAALVPDGATIQWGVGVVPEAVVAAFRNKRDLGVHSGFISSVVVDLVEAGTVTNLRKNIDRGRMVATVVGGDMRLYRYLHENPIFELQPADYTHNIRNLCQLESFVAINSAVEVDLTGQVNAETVAGVQVGGVGGQLDFVRGASASKDGRSFTVLPATASGGRVSRIVPRLAAGAGVTTPRHDSHFVVTEYGVADLRGKTLRQRAEALIAIAHPSFRAELEAAL